VLMCDVLACDVLMCVLNDRGHCGPSADVRRSATVTTTRAGKCRMSVGTALMSGRSVTIRYGASEDEARATTDRFRTEQT